MNEVMYLNTIIVITMSQSLFTSVRICNLSMYRMSLRALDSAVQKEFHLIEPV